MKILILQLARLGDIYTTWPTLNALKRKYPDAEIHILVRKKFSAACRGLKNIYVHELDTQKILKPLIFSAPITNHVIAEASFELGQSIDDLRKANFDKIYNLSFSPLSSDLTAYFTRDNSQVRGYTRYSDGYLSLPDDISAYFYSQVGIHRYNRVHLSEIFAALCEVELLTEDWQAPEVPTDKEIENQLNLLKGKEAIAIHIGASQIQKTYGMAKWRQVLVKLLKSTHKKIVLLGSSEEVQLANEIMLTVVSSKHQIVNLVGKTKVEELFPIIQSVDKVVGCDSVVMHIASLCDKQSLCLSFSSVNFWETGPLAKGSRVLYAQKPEDLSSEDVVQEILGHEHGATLFEKIDGTMFPSYEPMQGSTFQEQDDFAWKCIQALYMEGELPIATEALVISGLMRMKEITQLVLEQMGDLVSFSKSPYKQEVLNQSDELMKSVISFCPLLQPLYGWLEVQKIRVAPGRLESIFKETKQIYLQFLNILRLYIPDEKNEEGIGFQKNEPIER